jgi:hypothetical protein
VGHSQTCHYPHFCLKKCAHSSSRSDGLILAVRFNAWWRRGFIIPSRQRRLNYHVRKIPASIQSSLTRLGMNVHVVPWVKTLSLVKTGSLTGIQRESKELSGSQSHPAAL